MRPAILRDLQRLYDLHDAFKKQLEAVSPQSAEAWLDGSPLRKSTILQKFQNQSLLARRRINSRIGKKGADPSEALLVAKEIDKLVIAIFFMFFCLSDSDRLPSSNSTRLSSDPTTFSPRTSLFYDKATQPMDSGSKVSKRCKSLYIQHKRGKRIKRKQ